jgi:NitT/TauT family transport system substrate-binding protein
MMSSECGRAAGCLRDVAAKKGGFGMLIQSRRGFLTNAALAGAAGLGGFGAWGKALAAEPPPEVTTIRIVNYGGFGPTPCIAPQWAARELLSIEGFTHIRYVDFTKADAARAQAANIDPASDMCARGEADFFLLNPVDLAPSLEAGPPITVLSGVHAGCIELFANESIRSVADLRHRTVGLRGGVPDKRFVSIMASYVGIDPAKDINWVAITDPSVPIARVLEGGKIDAFLAIPPESQELRGRNVGHVIVNWATDRPWSQYVCCMLVGNSEFVRQNPVATKRALRAILKATDLCVSEPKRVARLLVEEGYTASYEHALQAMSDVRYDVWREYDPEDSLRFYALRMREAGFIKSGPNNLIEGHTDWRFLDELKRELKA